MSEYVYKIRIAGSSTIHTVPTDAKPQNHIVIRPVGTARNLNGEPVGAQGYPMLVMTWEPMSVYAYRWWARFVPDGKLSVRVTLVQVEDYGVKRGMALASMTPTTSWGSGVLELPVLADGVQLGKRGRSNTRSDYLLGRVTVTIRELGRKF